MNILVITYWSYREGLIQTYTLPYLRIISKLIAGNIYLVTLEKKEYFLEASEKAKEKSVLAEQGIVWVPIRYRPLTIGGAAIWGLDIARLTVLVIRQKIRKIHVLCFF